MLRRAGEWVTRPGRKRQHLVLFETAETVHILCGANMTPAFAQIAEIGAPRCPKCAAALRR